MTGSWVERTALTSSDSSDESSWIARMENRRRGESVHRLDTASGRFYFILPFAGYDDHLRETIAAGEHFRADDYGQIIAWGDGEPDQGLLADLTENYNVSVR